MFFNKSVLIHHVQLFRRSLAMLTNSQSNSDLSDFKKKCYAEKPMCVFLKYLTDKKWADFKDPKNKGHANRDVIQKNIKVLANMDPDTFTEKNGKFYNLSEPYKVIVLSRIFEFQNGENPKFEIEKSLEKNMDKMQMQYKKYPADVFENILRLRFENIIKTFDKNENDSYHQDFYNRDSLATAIAQYLVKHNLRAGTKCLLLEYFGYFSVQENTINEMKNKSDFIDAINVVRGHKIENQVIDSNENYKNISDPRDKDAFLSGVLKACNNHKWNFNNTQLLKLSSSEQKIIIPHLKGFTCPTDQYRTSRIKKQFATSKDIANFILEVEIQGSNVTEILSSPLPSNLISQLYFLLITNKVYEMDDAHAKILGVNMYEGIFNEVGITNWLDEICKNSKCKLSNIPDFVVAELVYAACNDVSYDFSNDIDFSGQKPKDEKDKDLEIINLLNFLIDEKRQKMIADFNFQQKKLYKPISSQNFDQKLRLTRIRIGLTIFVVLGSLELSLWLLSLISVTFCFAELGLFVFYQIIHFAAEHWSERNCINKIIKRRYTLYFLCFLQLPIILVTMFCSLAFSYFYNYCGFCCIMRCCPSLFDSDHSNDEHQPSLENYQDVVDNQNQIQI